MPKRPERKSKRRSGFQLLVERMAQLKAEGLDEDAAMQQIIRDENLMKAWLEDLLKIAGPELEKYAEGKNFTKKEAKDIAQRLLEIFLDSSGFTRGPEFH